MPGGLEQTLGVLLMTFILLDVFLTVLYARAGAGIIAPTLQRIVWRVFRAIARAFGKHSGTVLSVCGPVILIVFVVTWVLGLSLGSALFIQPHLGTSVRLSDGPTPLDFAAALYAAADSVAIVGNANLYPQTAFMRLFFVMNSLVGASVITLSLTYLMQVYNALQRRNTVGLKLHLLAGRSRDAARLLAGIGPRGQFAPALSILAETGAEITAVKEAHHFYPVLFYFRFPHSFYSTSHTTTLALDCVTLVRSALSDRFEWLKQSATVVEIWEASLLLIRSIEESFLSHKFEDVASDLDPQRQAILRRRYFDALEILKSAGIETTENETAGAEYYLRLRSSWDAHLFHLAPIMLYDVEEIDPPANNPGFDPRGAETAGTPALR